MRHVTFWRLQIINLVKKGKKKKFLEERYGQHIHLAFSQSYVKTCSIFKTVLIIMEKRKEKKTNAFYRIC